jgi:hypothetical protein
VSSTHRGDVVQLVRTLPSRWLESHTVTLPLSARLSSLGHSFQALARIELRSPDQFPQSL